MPMKTSADIQLASFYLWSSTWNAEKGRGEESAANKGAINDTSEVAGKRTLAIPAFVKTKTDGRV